MATATKPAPAKKAPEPGTLEYLQHALEDLKQARTHAQQDAQTGIDAASERIRAAAEDVRGRIQEEAEEFQHRLDRASDEVRIELGKVAVHAQRSPEALNELAREIRHAKESFKEPVKA